METTLVIIIRITTEQFMQTGLPWTVFRGEFMLQINPSGRKKVAQELTALRILLVQLKKVQK